MTRFDFLGLEPYRNARNVKTARPRQIFPLFHRMPISPVVSVQESPTVKTNKRLCWVSGYSGITYIRISTMIS